MQGQAEWFERAITLSKEISQLIEQRSKAYSAAIKTTPVYSDMPKGSDTSSALQNSIDRICELDDAINALIDKLYTSKREILTCIMAVHDPLDKLCMTKRYTSLKSWGKIANEMGISKASAVFRAERGINCTIFSITS